MKKHEQFHTHAKPPKKSYTEFTAEMKNTHTILCPDIFPIHMHLLQEVFKMYGYHVRVLKDDGKKVIDTGLKYIHNDMCYPAICAVGQMLYALTQTDIDIDHTALIYFQTGGGCRASNYIWLLRKALHNLHMDQVPVISISFGGLEKHSGFHLTPPMLFKGLMSVVYGDMLMLLKNQVRPYENNPGDAQRCVDKWTKNLTEQFRHNRGLVGKAVKKNLSQIVKDFHDIPRTVTPKVKVGIVGEIYVKYSPLGNNGLEAYLESQDCEYMVPGVLGFVQYCFANMETDYQYYGGKKLYLHIGHLAEAGARLLEKYMLDALKPYPDFTAPKPFSKTKEMAQRVLDRGVKMGEGWLLPAEMGELIESGYENIVCAQPFGCLPNHIVGKGVVRTLKTLFPNSNICPVDYDAGASKVNQENRIKLMLSVAREQLEQSMQSDTGASNNIPPTPPIKHSP